MGDSTPDLCEDDFQPNMLPSRPPGDFGLPESVDRNDSSDSVLCIPSNCNVILGGACTAVMGPTLFLCSVLYCDPEPMLETDGLGACDIVCS